MFFDDFYMGQVFTPQSVVLERDKMLAFAREYAPLSLHLDDEYARASQLRGLVSPGIMNYLWVWARFVETQVLADSLLAELSARIEWLAPVYAGDELFSDVTVAGLVSKNSRSGIVELAIEAYNQDDVKVLHSATKALVRKKYGAL